MGLTSQHLDPFRILTSDERCLQQQGLIDQMHSRDGEPSLSQRTLPRRESLLEDMGKPIHWLGERPSQEELTEHLSGRQTSRDPRILWLAAATRAQRGEKAGIDPELDRFDRGQWAGTDLGLMYMAMEDHHHTKLFGQALRCAGIEPQLEGPRPYEFWRWLMSYLPNGVRFGPILVGESCGAALMAVLAENIGVFREPELEERIRWIVDEILTDEIGHVVYARARVHPTVLRVARRSLRPAARSLVRGIPEAATLAGGADQLVERMLRGPILTDAAVAWLGKLPGAL